MSCGRLSRPRLIARSKPCQCSRRKYGRDDDIEIATERLVRWNKPTTSVTSSAPLVDDAVAIHGYRGACSSASPRSVHTFDHGLQRWSVHYTLTRISRRGFASHLMFTSTSLDCADTTGYIVRHGRWDGIVAAVTHRRSRAIALSIAAASGAFMALAGSNTGC